MGTSTLTRVFIIEDDPVFAKLVAHTLGKEDMYDIKIFNSGQAFMQELHTNPDIVSIDYSLPDINGIDILRKIKDFNQDISTVVLSGQTKVEVVVDAYEQGANHYLIKNPNTPIEFAQIVKNLNRSVNLRKEVETLREQIIDRNKYNSVIGESPDILKVLKLVQKVERSNIQVLITGESGTGKEVIANVLHYNSPRKKRPFVAVNVAAIPPDLIESELFGHEKGAFTGASSRRIGKFEEANGGTIFLDEIGEMQMDLQTKLLRVLQESKVTRLGSNKEISLDVRVIAATNKNLSQQVKESRFREDLYYRLQGFLIPLPGLKERGNDILILAKHFLNLFCKSNRMRDKRFSPEAAKVLLEHGWPGNVRELKATVERAALIAESELVEVEDLIFSEAI